MILLGSLKAATDLLDKRSANYSDRQSSVMVQLSVVVGKTEFPSSLTIAVSAYTGCSF